MTADGRIRLALLGQYPLDAGDYGGVYSHMSSLVKGFRNYPTLDVHVITLSTRLSREKTTTDGNVTVHYLPSRLPRLMASVGLDQMRIIRKVYELNPDLIHAHMTAPVYGLPSALLAGSRKVMLTVHGLVSEESKTWPGLLGRLKAFIYRPMEDYALGRIRHIIVVSEYVRDRIRNRTKSEIRVVSAGISDEFFSVSGGGKEGRLLFVGGIEPRKGLLCLLEAVKIVLPKSGVRLRIVGGVRDPSYQRQLEEYIEKNGIAHAVTFTGPEDQDALVEEYRECSIFILPSREESEGLVMLEAMACGKPVIASNIGGIPHFVEDGITGILIPYGKPAELAEKMLMLVNDKAMRERMGAAGREKAMSYTGDRTAAQIHAIYEEVLGE